MTDTFQVPDGYKRRNKLNSQRMVTVRRLTRDEVLNLCAGSRVKFVSTQGTLREAKVNGVVRTWKRDPNRVEVPLKYGIYEYAVLDLKQAMDQLVVEVVEETT